VVAGGGLVLIGVAAGLIWQRRRTGEAAARRWITTGIGALLIAGGAVALVLGIRHWRREPGTTVALGSRRCDALADAQRALDAGHAGSARETTLVALERCQLLAADATTAELIADRTHRLRALAP